MAIIDDTFLQDMADLVTEIELKDDCQILPDTEGTLDGMGGAPHTWSSSSTVKGAVLDWNTPSQDYMIAHQIVGMVVKKMHLELGTVVRKSWHLMLRGVVYRVVEPIPGSSFSVVTQVIVVVTTLGA